MNASFAAQTFQEPLIKFRFKGVNVPLAAIEPTLALGLRIWVTTPFWTVTPA